MQTRTLAEDAGWLMTLEHDVTIASSTEIQRRYDGCRQYLVRMVHPCGTVETVDMTYTSDGSWYARGQWIACGDVRC